MNILYANLINRCFRALFFGFIISGILTLITFVLLKQKAGVTPLLFAQTYMKEVILISILLFIAEIVFDKMKKRDDRVLSGYDKWALSRWNIIQE